MRRRRSATRRNRASSSACSARPAAPLQSPDVNDPGFRNDPASTNSRATYREAIDGLIEGGATTLMVETIFDTLNAKAALFAIEDVFDARRSACR